MLDNVSATDHSESRVARLRASLEAHRHLLKATGWTFLFLLALLSLTPGNMLVRSPAPATIEHMLAYAAAGSLLSLGYSRTGAIGMILGLAAYAGLLEALQMFVPGRSAQVAGFIASAFGATIGILLGRWAFGADRAS